ncbi:MAG: cyclic nucleotide-binding domain-containing protein [Myxococcota bacterium]
MKLIEAMRASLASAENEAVVLWEGFSGRAVRGRRAQVLYHATDPSDAVYLLLSGEARCYVDGEHGAQTTLLVRAPAVLGDRDVLAGTESTESIDLLSPSRLLLWSHDEFLREWAGNDSLRHWLFRDVAGRYAASLRFAALATAPAKTRVQAVAASLRLDRIDTEFLAQACGVAEKTAARALASMDKDAKSAPELWHTLCVEHGLFLG